MQSGVTQNYLIHFMLFSFGIVLIWLLTRKSLKKVGIKP